MSNALEPILRLGPPFNMVVLLVLIGGVVTVISAIAKQSRKYACHRAETNLKRDLVERGLSVEEIERIVAASSGASPEPE